MSLRLCLLGLTFSTVILQAQPGVAQSAEMLLQHEGPIYGLAFSPDGRYLAMNTENAVRLINLPIMIGGSEPIHPTALPGLWDDLASADATKAYRAHWRLVLGGKASVGFLQGRLRPVEAAPADRLARLIRDLDSDRYPIRENATQELEKLGEGAGPALRRALATDPSPEVRRRIESMLARHCDSRLDRAVDILESIGDGSARELLARLAAGMPEARLTREATAALDRLAKRTLRTRN